MTSKEVKNAPHKPGSNSAELANNRTFDFELRLINAGGHYSANVLKSPAGQASTEFHIDFEPEFLGQLFSSQGRLRHPTRGGGASLQAKQAMEFGDRLFRSVFVGEVRSCLDDSLGRAAEAGSQLRIRLSFGKVPELVDLPWELLYDAGRRQFVALNDKLTLVRDLPTMGAERPVQVSGPLNVLVAIANPDRDWPLDVKGEFHKLELAMARIRRGRAVRLEQLPAATFDDLIDKLKSREWHVFHFIGHGEYDDEEGAGKLLFESKSGQPDAVGASRIADVLREHESVRLVVINACEGGQTSRTDPFAGIAQALVHTAIPAVVAMQYPVTDFAAVKFADAFYRALVDGSPVDRAMYHARYELKLKGEDNEIEWATPVLYMRGDGHLFRVPNVSTRHWRMPFLVALVILIALGSLWLFLARDTTLVVLQRLEFHGDKHALDMFKVDMKKQGYGWEDFSEKGPSLAELTSQVKSGDVPIALQTKGPLIPYWDREHPLARIDSVAKEQDWDRLLPPEISERMKIDGHYVAAPFSLGRVNWLYINKTLLDRVGGKAPQTWQDFFELADKLKADKVDPVAGGDWWLDLILWEDVILSQGATFYEDALVNLDQKALMSNQMVGVFKTYRRIESYIDKRREQKGNNPWKDSAAMVIKDKAGMLFIGDWMNGEFAAAHKKLRTDYICVPVPGTEGVFTYNVDAFVFFKQKWHSGATDSQLAMARTIMSPDFQQQLSQYKGSVPVRLDVPVPQDSDCAQQFFTEKWAATTGKNTYVPSLALEMLPATTVSAVKEVIGQFLRSGQSAEDAVQELAKALLPSAEK